MGHDPTFVHLTDLHFGEPDDPHLHSDTDAIERAPEKGAVKDQSRANRGGSISFPTPIQMLSRYFSFAKSAGELSLELSA